MDYMQATPRNRFAGLLADALQNVDAFASKPFGYENPPGAMLSGLLGIPALARTADRVSYGEPLTTGSGMTTRLKDDTIDAGLLAAPFAARSPQALKAGAKALVALEEKVAANAAKTAVPPMRGQLGAVIPNGMNLANDNIQALARGERVSPVQIGILTDDQFSKINAKRLNGGFDPLPSKEVHYIGKHHADSRSKDGYVPQDLLKQLMSGLDDTASVGVDRSGRVNLVSTRPRYDGYASTVNDTVALIPSRGQTIAEAYSVIPKGDKETVAALQEKMAGVPPGVVSGVSRNQRIEHQPIPSVVTNQDVRNWIAQDNAARMLGLPPGNTAMDRAKALGFTEPVYRGTKASEVTHSGSLWATDAPQAANYYAGHVVQDELYPMLPRHQGGNVMPLLARKDAVAAPEPLANGGNRYLIPAESVRSRFAAFDPARVNENDLLGRADPWLLGLLGIGAGGAAYAIRDK